MLRLCTRALGTAALKSSPFKSWITLSSGQIQNKEDSWLCYRGLSPEINYVQDRHIQYRTTLQEMLPVSGNW